MLIAYFESATHLFGRLVAVDSEDGPRDRVGEDPVPARGGAGEVAGCFGVDGSVPGEGDRVEGVVDGGAEEREDGNGDLDGGADAAEPRVGGAGVGFGCCGQQHVGEDVDADGVERATVRDEVVEVGPRTVEVFFGRGRLGSRGVAATARLELDLLAGLADRLGFGVGDVACHLGESVVDAVEKDGGAGDVQFGHAVVEVVDADGTDRGRVGVPFAEGLVEIPLGAALGDGAQA